MWQLNPQDGTPQLHLATPSPELLSYTAPPLGYTPSPELLSYTAPPLGYPPSHYRTIKRTGGQPCRAGQPAPCRCCPAAPGTAAGPPAAGHLGSSRTARFSTGSSPPPPRRCSFLRRFAYAHSTVCRLLLKRRVCCLFFIGRDNRVKSSTAVKNNPELRNSAVDSNS